MSVRKLIEAVLAFVLVAIVLVVAATVVALLNDRSSTSAAPPRTSSTLPRRANASHQDFLDHWERSQTGPYVMIGKLERIRGDLTEILAVREARTPGRALEQTGAVAVVIEGGLRRVCEVFSTTDVRCGNPEPAQSVAESVAELQDQLSPTGPYLLLEGDEPTCFVLVYDGPAALGARFGQETAICFDTETGAIWSQRQSTGSGRLNITADELRPTVNPDDLLPG